MDEKELKRNSVKDAARAKRGKRRKKIVFLERTAIVVGCAGLLVGGGLIVYNLMPEVKVARQLEEANAYIETQDYEDFISGLGDDTG